MADDESNTSPESWKREDIDEVSIVRCGTSSGPFTLRLERMWSPHGYDRAVHLFNRGFYDNTHFFRVVPSFLVQFGISYTNSEDLRDTAKATIPDDPQLDPPIPFEEGTVSFAGSGKDSRTSQLFISYSKSSSLGTQLWETPIGKVVDGMQNVKNFYSEYGDGPPYGNGPKQHKIEREGRKYIENDFPLLDKFLRCTVHEGDISPKADAVDKSEFRPDKLDQRVERLSSDTSHIILPEEISQPRRDRLKSAPSRRTSAYQDHHQKLQASQESDLVAVIAVGVVVILAIISMLVFNGSRKKGSKKS
uniref:PPIase cyclophilin-type domain-containing protein n=1 Tax=Pseudictyota dubia TaxID=2749911 RepID=A0A7R9WAA1_9STRA|mmetsp:Transcript_39403/g.72702  ORF Transcript_39403/g.72702 Transcript_39403/m.72702 type:complete len:305 (+) Transcript_39403:49-963(+)